MRRTTAIALLLGALGGCARPAPPNEYAEEQHKRIVSLAPSLTEMLFALGAGPQVVGTSAYSAFPAAARKLPVIDAAGWIDSEKILALQPDFVVGLPSDAARTQNLERAKVAVFLMKDAALDDVYRDIDELGVLTGRIDAAQRLEHSIRARLAALRKRAAAFRRHPRVFVVLDVAPIYTVGRGSYLDTLLQMAGARNVVTTTAAYPSFSAERLVADQPDALIVGTSVRLGPLLARPPWSDLRAVRAGRIFAVPAGTPLEVPGPRVAEGLAWLVGVVERLQR